MYACMRLCVCICADVLLIERLKERVGQCYVISFLHYLSLLGLCYANAQQSRKFKVPRFQDFSFFFFKNKVIRCLDCPQCLVLPC